MSARRIVIDTLEELVVALCLDYSRRERHIEAHSVSHRTETEYKYLNFKIYDAAAEICGERYAPIYIEEIGRRIGYAKSRTHLSEVTYKRYKNLIKMNIARVLHLID